ncbi:MAG TPA: sodium:solute symporter [Cyclobacteriaceae bacterium]|nr:sodium:solute symporter [Cyclobacteriaceae bacterium]HNU42227.1 sodium:solute symporter [Cyclobacteriaceae bacterium]
MNLLDWIILFGTLLFIVLYGAWKTKETKNIDGYLKGDNNLKWWMIGISIMATQASAVTFLSTPGQAMDDGMRFLQFYFGLPLAMVIISVTMVPIYYRLKVYTAYEYLETRFDLKTRTLAAILFLILRGLSAGITLYAPSIVLSTILGWNIAFTTVLIGMLVIIYSVSGGTKAVSLTQRQQMTIIMGGMLLAGIMAYSKLPESISFTDTIQIAGELGKLNIVTTDFSLSDRFNIWSGLLASTFLFLSYFGTDQSQVARYLGGKSIAESRMGLIFNGLLKIPMQFIILFIGVLVFVFYLFNQPPVFHNQTLKHQAAQTIYADSLAQMESGYNAIYSEKQKAVHNLVSGIQSNNETIIQSAKAEYNLARKKEDSVRLAVKKTIASAVPGSKTQDRDYMFLNFVLSYLPHGVIGLILAVMFSAAMGSMAGELNALSSTTTVDIYKRSIRQEGSDRLYLNASRLFTIMWALLAMVFATLANQAENLIQFVNIIGSLFYGTILGIFLVAFYLKSVKSNAVFVAAIIGEATVLACYFFFYEEIAFLYYNIIGCVVVVLLAWLLRFLDKQPNA